jgi:hypothetical protein
MLGDVSSSIHDTARIEMKVHRDGRKKVGTTILQEQLVERTACQCTAFREDVWIAQEKEKHWQRTFI